MIAISKYEQKVSRLENAQIILNKALVEKVITSKKICKKRVNRQVC